MAAIEVFAPAKINLTLHVTGQRADGYHLLDSLVVFANVGDRLWFEPAPDTSLEITGRFAARVPADPRNLVWKAADVAGRRLRIRLEKNLPHGAGLGGGSSDAAALLRAFDSGDSAAGLGADVPVCLWAGPQRMRGIGEQLERLYAVPECHLVLVHPGIAVPTPAVFATLGRKENPEMGVLPRWHSIADFVAWLAAQRNDLQQPAQEIAPAIRAALDSLGDALVTRMSGSGSACFGLYPGRNEARLAARRILASRPDWWVQRVRTVGGGMP